MEASGRLDRFIQKALMNADECVEVSTEEEENSVPEKEPEGKRKRTEFSPEEDETLIRDVAAGIPITRINLGNRDRKTIADHYKILQKRARLEGRELPNPRRIYAIRSPPVTPTKIRTLPEPKPKNDDSN